jgi:hypothetical protein
MAGRRYRGLRGQFPQWQAERYEKAPRHEPRL